jgi:hypothetical protein
MHFPIALHPVAEPNAPTYCLDIEYIKCLTHIKSASRLYFYNIFTKKFKILCSLQASFLT